MTYQNILWRRSWFPVWYAFCPDEKAFRREMLKSTDPTCEYPTSAGCCVTYDDDKGERCSLLTLSEDVYKEHKKYPYFIPGIVVHECVHIVESVITKMVDRYPSEEFRAYATQAIFVELMGDVHHYIERRKTNGHND